MLVGRDRQYFCIVASLYCQLSKHCKMSGIAMPPLPPQLKSIQHYLKTAAEHDKRDPVVSYYCKYCLAKFSLKGTFFGLVNIRIYGNVRHRGV